MTQATLPPLPYAELKTLPYTVQEYLRILREIVIGAVEGTIPWVSVDKAGSNLNEIVTRNHNDLQNVQGGTSGEFYHLTSAQHTSITGFLVTNLGDLTDGGDTTLHFHASDRARANHTGTQLMSTISDLPTLASTTYTPTLTNVANLDGSTAYECQYIRVGNVITVSGKVDVNPTAAASTQLGISLPVASNIGATEDCAGAAFSPAIAGQGAAILGDASNNRAQMEWIAVDTTNQSMYFTFTYQVI